MFKRKRVICLSIVLGICAAGMSILPGFSRSSTAIKSYIIVSQTYELPSGLAKKVVELNGEITGTIPEIGIALAASIDPNFKLNASLIRGIRSVIPDVAVRRVDPNLEKNEIAEGSVVNPPDSDEDDTRFNLQWALHAIDAPEAWNAGARGAGAKVFVLDSGIDADHPDIAPNLITSLCTSFVPGEGWNDESSLKYFSHGTWTSGIIAAADNGVGTIGVAPEAQLVMVKVISDIYGYGLYSWGTQGIIYAANNGADVINMSFGFPFKHSGYWDFFNFPPPPEWVWVTPDEVAELINVDKRALNYAYQKGVTIVASAGNDGIDLDHSADVLIEPAQLPNVIAVSATAPHGWVVDFETNLDVPASYTNFGQSFVDFAAPGGSFDYYYEYPGCYSAFPYPPYTSYRPCYVFDCIIGPSTNTWWFQAGTSAAAPHVAGVAALIIGQNGGSMHPAQVYSILQKTADDLGKPGRDDYYGHGRVNAYKAVKYLMK